MAEYRDRQKLTDDQVKRILTSTETWEATARAVGCTVRTIWHYRARQSKRALRIARELGLPPLVDKPPFVKDGLDERAYVPNGVRR